MNAEFYLMDVVVAVLATAAVTLLISPAMSDTARYAAAFVFSVLGLVINVVLWVVL
ncbi:MAG: hypothetical protein ACRCZZ_08260 [Phocaeicola sp.]